MSNQNPTEQIKNRIRLSDVIGKDTKLIAKGKEFLGKCPFHMEKTPSFTVNNQKGLYYCFGCGVSGDVFTYLQEKKGMTFQSALEELAQITHVEIPQFKREEQNKFNDLFALNEKACLFFTSYKDRIVEYLNKRGINNNSIEKFRLGYCPDNTELFNELKQAFSTELLKDSGLFVNEKCRFRNRLIFPIFNYKGQVIAFGGRILDANSKLPKYVNSPDTPIFKKHEHLYGLYQNRPKRDFILVEGYLDVITLYQHQDFNAVAPLGTSTSIEQCELLWKYAEKPIVCFDGDEAGKKAGFRLIEKVIPFLRSNKSFDFFDLPDDEDPDSFVLHLKKLKRVSFIDKLWYYLSYKVNFKVPEEVVKLKDKVFEITKKQSKSLGYAYRKQLLDYIWQHYKKPLEQKKYFPKILSKRRKKEFLEEILLATLINHSTLIEEVQENLGRVNFSTSRLEQLRHKVLDNYFMSEDMDVKEWVNIEKLEQDIPFIQKETDLSIVRSGWWEVWYRRFESDQLHKELMCDTLDVSHWQKIQHVKKGLVIGD